MMCCLPKEPSFAQTRTASGQKELMPPGSPRCEPESLCIQSLQENASKKVEMTLHVRIAPAACLWCPFPDFALVLLPQKSEVTSFRRRAQTVETNEQDSFLMLCNILI